MKENTCHRFAFRPQNLNLRLRVEFVTIHILLNLTINLRNLYIRGVHTSSLLKRRPARCFFRLGNRWKSDGAKSGEYGADEAAIQIHTPEFWPLRPVKCEPVRCPGEKSHPSRASLVVPDRWPWARIGTYLRQQLPMNSYSLCQVSFNHILSSSWLSPKLFSHPSYKPPMIHFLWFICASVAHEK
jgi:hypothetical protein